MTTRYTINPSLRLCTWCLVVGWHEVKDSLLQSENIFSCEGRSIYTKGDRCMIMAQVNEKRIDFITAMTQNSTTETFKVG